MHTLERIQNIVSNNLGVNKEKIIPAALIIDDLGADSLDVVDTIMAIEEEFNLEIPDAKAEGFRTVQDVVDYVDAHTT